MSRQHRRDILERRRKQIWNRLLRNPHRLMTEHTKPRTQILLWGECILRSGWRKERFGYVPSYERQ